ncbi:CYTH domain-containing protein [Peribacillus loiseleuriae]|uniref:CYTH domain-containing protein n=1 Tax=Peribacillus loiseleuriae TaxID=1679170 RepID=UPI003CFE8FA0
MNQHLEIEFKNLLTKEEFQRLKQSFSVKESDFIYQENHYFDTPQFSLKENESALRIRHKKGHYELTLKQPAKEGLLETNQPLSKEEADSLLQGNRIPEGYITTLIGEMGIHSDIQFFGTLGTNRAEFAYKGGLLVLDHSLYLNTEDFEVEYEVTNNLAGKEIFDNLLDSLQIPIRKTENKVRRFYQAKKKQL